MRIGSFILDLVFPRRCVFCLRILPAGALCAECRRGVELHCTLFCGRCRARLPVPGGGTDLFRIRAPCHPSACPLGAAADYTGAVKCLVRELKFALVREAAAELGGILAGYIGALGRVPGAEAVPVPLSKRRRRERGFNQAELIAEAFAARSSAYGAGGNIEVNAPAMRRVRNTKPQSGLSSHAERLGNVKDCFGTDPGRIKGRRILLIDDVATSGATLQAAILALKAAGAGRVLALVAAKA